MWRSLFYRARYFHSLYVFSVFPTDPWIPATEPTASWTCIEASDATWSAAAKDAETWTCDD